jgi:hypothetical protein
MALVFLAGCEMNVKEVTSRLRIGMTKMEMDQCLKGQKFLKEQVALIYPNSTEEKTRAAVWSGQEFKFVYPEDLIAKRLTFNGDVKVYSYLVKEKRKFAVPISIEYLAIFYNKRDGKVIGWAQIRTVGEASGWNDKF